jgi:hypothetical protein
MSISADIAYYRRRELTCRANAANAADADIAMRHRSLADLHAARCRLLAEEPQRWTSSQFRLHLQRLALV